mgnify:CR=1 FL=1
MPLSGRDLGDPKIIQTLYRRAAVILITAAADPGLSIGLISWIKKKYGEGYHHLSIIIVVR